MAPSTRRWVAGGILAFVPLVAVYLSPARGDTALVYVGLLPAFVALTVGPRVALGTALATGLAVFVGLLLSTSPLAAGALLAALAVGVAWSYSRGWQAAATYVATQAALAAVAAPRTTLLSAAGHPPSSVESAALVTAFVLFGGLWIAALGFLLLRDLASAMTHHDPDVSRDDLVLFGALLAVLLGVGTWAIITWAPGSNAWWLLLTVLVVLSPDHSDTVGRAVARAGGTVAGGAIAAGTLALGANGTVVGILGLIAALSTAVTFVRAPYWAFSMTLTMALVWLTLPRGRVFRGDLERVGFTVLAAAVVVALSALAQVLARRRRLDIKTT